jgi:hypothetical protein
MDHGDGRVAVRGDLLESAVHDESGEWSAAVVEQPPVMVRRLLRTTVTGAAVAVVTLALLNLPSARFWQLLVAVQLGSVALIAAFLFYDAIWQIVLVVQAKRIRDYESDLHAAMGAAVASIVDAFGAPWDEIAVCYYRARSFSRWRRLVRVGAVRAGAALTEVEVERELRTGIGPVGVAFAEMSVIREEWQDFIREAKDKGVTAWHRRTNRERYGLTWGQVWRSWQPAGVVARPTFNLAGRPDGCILIAGPIKPADLPSEQMLSIVNDCAAVADEIGPPPKGWWRMHGR